jgi:hypothetical protein
MTEPHQTATPAPEERHNTRLAEIPVSVWEEARRDPATREFVQQAIAREKALEREGLIKP